MSDEDNINNQTDGQEAEMDNLPVTLDDAIASEFNTAEGRTIPRELMICYLNVATKTSPSWSALGKRVGDSSISFDWSDESNQDILGNVNSSMKKPVLTQSFDPCNLEREDSAIERIWNLAVKQQDYAALTDQDLLVVHFYAGSEDAPFAERYPSSMVKPTGLGGEGGGSMEMPIDITYGGQRAVGTASKNANGEVTFTQNN